MKSIIGLLLCFVMTPAFAKQTPQPVAAGESLNFLSFTEMRSLQPELRREYQRELQEFLVKVSEDGSAPGAAWNALLAPTGKFARLGALIDSARAADVACGPGMFGVGNNNQLCYGKPGQWSCMEGDSGVQTAANKCPNEFKSFMEHPTRIAPEGATAPAWNGQGAAGENLKRRMADLNTKAQEEAKKNGVQTPAQGSANVAEEPKEKKEPLRCIYAGFPREGSKKEDCKPVSEWGGFKCPAPGGGKGNSGTVLCNPVVFGTAKEGDKETGYCVPRNKDATKNCLAKSKKDGDGALDRAMEQAKKDPKALARVGDGLSELCDGGNKKTQDNFARMGQDLNDDSKNDLKETCGSYGDAFSRYYNRVGGGSNGSPGRH